MDTMDQILETHFRVAQPATPERPDNGPDSTISLQPPEFDAPGSLMEAMQTRRRERCFASTPLSLPALNNILWAANGINLPAGFDRITTSPLATGQIEIYAMVLGGIYRYDVNRHLLTLVKAVNPRSTEYIEIISHAPLTLIYVARLIGIAMISERRGEIGAGVFVGEIAQNLHLYCCRFAPVSPIWR
jgi:hypothetical protein